MPLQRRHPSRVKQVHSPVTLPSAMVPQLRQSSRHHECLCSPLLLTKAVLITNTIVNIIINVFIAFVSLLYLSNPQSRMLTSLESLQPPTTIAANNRNQNNPLSQQPQNLPTLSPGKHFAKKWDENSMIPAFAHLRTPQIPYSP